MRRDTDNATPGTLPDQQTQFHEFEAVREDIAIGTCVLVRYSDYRTQDGSVWIRMRCHPSAARHIRYGDEITSLKAVARHARRRCNARQPTDPDNSPLQENRGETLHIRAVPCQEYGRTRLYRPSFRGHIVCCWIPTHDTAVLFRFRGS